MALIRTLNHKDRERIRTHFKNLDSDSLYARFMGTINPETLDRYVDRIDFNRDIILGIEDIETFELIGLAEVHPDFDQKNNKYSTHEADIAFTVSKNKQNKGLGKELVRKAVLAARNKGFEKVRLSCWASNMSMRKLAAKQGLKLQNYYGDIVGEMELEDPNIYTKTEELRDDIMAELASASSKVMHHEMSLLSDLTNLTYRPFITMMDFLCIDLNKNSISEIKP